MMIEAIHLTKQYGTAKALFDANFSIEKGEIVGFLGPNGAGKSTTMNLLCGYLTPSWGQVRIAGVDMAENPLEAKRHIGYLPEIPPLYMDMTVAEQLEFACELRGLRMKKSEMRAYIDKLCARTQILDTRDRLIRNLSKGYRQRVAVTQLLVGEPEILILDSADSALDYRTAAALHTAIRRDCPGTTLVVISERIASLKDADRILVMEDGRITDQGTHDGLLTRCERYRHMAELQMGGGAL